MLKRCIWVNPENDLDLKYHDEEWWVEVHDDRLLFEFLVLEGAQAWLSWTTILKKREWYRKSFDNFDFDKIALYDQNKIDSLLLDEGIIRNRLKINSVIKNARVFIEIRKEFGSFDFYIWSFVWKKQLKNSFKDIKEIPSSTQISDIISKDLKKRWMSFVGTTIIYAFMQAIWIVNDHTTDCFRYNFCLESRL